jgi:hypothetical protein
MPPPATGSRETRLLVVTLIVSAGMLLLLARFRFPERPAADLPVAPLERLASRATYDDLAGVLRSLDRQIANAVVALSVVVDGVEPGPSRLAWMGFISQAGVTLGLTLILAAEYPTWGARVQTLMVALIALHQLIGPVLFRAAPRARGGDWRDGRRDSMSEGRCARSERRRRADD